MHLKQIELENFKSFGKKITVPLLEGYTAVTGPNGSGKSNITDAILFVLGPKSSRAIRAGKLSDLIFNGGASKSPADYCKASLVFDNSDRVMPIDVDEVRLTRLIKMSQSGGDGYTSTFYVNDRKSSLGEFDSLLSHARISADGYNFVQQGDVTRIVSMSNLERRRILDGISGISRFDEDIAKAKGERDEADANIDRISIVLDELARQLAQLEQEKETALTYLRTKEQLERSKAQMAWRRKEASEAEMASTARQMKSFEDEIQSIRARRKEIAERVKELDQGMLDADRELEARGGREFIELRERIDALRVEVARSDDKASQAVRDGAEAEAELAERVQETAATAEEVEAARAEATEASSRLEASSKKLESAKSDLAKVQATMSARSSELAQLEKETAASEKEVRDREAAAHRLAMEAEALQARKARIEADLASGEEEVSAAEFNVSDAEWRIKEIKDKDKGSGKELKDLQEKFLLRKGAETRLSKESDELEQAIKNLMRELSRLKAEEEAAGDVARGYNRAVRGVLEARDSRAIRGIHGTIAELAEVDEKYGVALNIAAGGRMQAIVVDDDEVASQCIQHLKRNGLGRATFLPLTKMLDGRPRGKAIMAAKEAVGLAIDLVRFDEKYRAAFWYVLGDTVVVETLDQARRLMGGVRLVTSGGELLEASGAMVGGNAEASQLKFGAASKGRQDEVSAKLDQAIRASEEARQDLKAVRDELLIIEARMRELSGAGGASSLSLKALETQRDQASARLQQLRQAERARREELDSVKSDIARSASEAAGAAIALEAARQGLESVRDRLEKAAPKELSEKLKALQADMADLSAAVADARAAKETAEAKEQLTARRLADLEKDSRSLEERVEQCRKDAEECAARSAQAKTELTALRAIEASMGKEMEALRKKKESLFKQKTSLESERDALAVKEETTSGVVTGLVVRMGQLTERVKELEEELARYGREVETPMPSMEALKDAIRQCEAALESMGAVNLRAVEDHAEKTARRDELASETARLEAQRRDLLELEKDLNGKKKACLLAVHAAVNGNFRRLYAELSQGGEADLVLENEEEPFEGGLVIRAKPRQGKAMRLDALSGGEKSLTALAFIFALQEHQPSPFYLLDEVDAFLDGINADMVAKRVRKSSRTAQFVQISHRKITLAQADHIIGVTKQDGGLSHVIMKPRISDISEVQAELGIKEETEGGTS